MGIISFFQKGTSGIAGSYDYSIFGKPFSFWFRRIQLKLEELDSQTKSIWKIKPKDRHGVCWYISECRIERIICKLLLSTFNIRVPFSCKWQKLKSVCEESIPHIRKLRVLLALGMLDPETLLLCFLWETAACRPRHTGYLFINPHSNRISWYLQQESFREPVIDPAQVRAHGRTNHYD